MIGIYMIRNNKTGQCYIGQSTDIEKRYKEHLYHKVSEIDKAIHEYGSENFTLSVLELCDPEELDYKEEYYIRLYDTVNNGYNQNYGGQQNSYGDQNPNSKLVASDVYFIRECYRTHQRSNDVYERYFKDKISLMYFKNIWSGTVWRHTHMDVYTPENIYYYSRQATNGELSDKAVFTNREIFKMREAYQTKTAKEIYEDFELQNKCKFQTLQQILWGRSYNNSPVYDKKRKIWMI